MKKTLLILVLVYSAISCKDTTKDKIIETAETVEKYPNLKKAEWLIGNWGNTSQEGILTETWIKVNDSVYNGATYFTVKNDTVFSEDVKLKETNGKLTYVVTVPDQNDGKAVNFNMTSITVDNVVFENPKHDYPSKLTYTKIDADSIVAMISGVKNGIPAKETFAMGRLKK